MRATPLVEHEAQKAAAAAKAAAKAAELAEAVAAIPDQEFDQHPAIVAERAHLADIKRRLRAATAARAELDSNPTPARIEQTRAELDERTRRLAPLEAEAVKSGSDAALAEAVKERAAVRALADTLETLETGWAAVLSAVGCDTSDEALKALEAERDQAEARIATTLEQLKHARVTGAEARAAFREAQRAAAERERQELEARGAFQSKNARARVIAARRAEARAADRYQSV